MAQSPVIFSSTAQAILAGHVVRAVYGVKLQLTIQTIYLCNGDSFTDTNGQKWTGLGLLGSLSGVSAGAEVVTAPLQMTLSGVIASDRANAAVLSELSAAIADANNEVFGNTVYVYLLFFNATTAQAIDAPYLLQIYQMGTATFSYDGGSNTATITIPADPLFGGKHIPQLNIVSHADQTARAPGDKIFERMGWKKTVVTAT